MSYNTPEISNEDGKPIGLYEFRYGDTYWRYCTADEDQIVGPDELGGPATWVAKTILDDGVVQGGSDQNDLQINVQSDLPINALFRAQRPSGKVWLTVKKYHLGDAEEDTPIQWAGSVVNSIAVDPATNRLECRSIGGTYDRNGLRLAWGRMCPHPLYGIGCNVDKSLHAYPREIATLTNTNFTCTAHSEPVEGSFSGGFLEWARGDGTFERLGINKQAGNDFQVLGSTAGLEIGTAVTIYPGCPRNTSGCILFDNLANYGGFPHLPGKSPFDGTPVF